MSTICTVPTDKEVRIRKGMLYFFSSSFGAIDEYLKIGQKCRSSNNTVFILVFKYFNFFFVSTDVILTFPDSMLSIFAVSKYNSFSNF